MYIFPHNKENNIITKGIENVYPEIAFRDDVFYEQEISSEGCRGIVWKIDKIKFADYILENSKSVPEYFFSNFKGLFEELRRWLQ